MNPDVFQAASTGNLSFFVTDPSSTLLQATTTKNTVLHLALQFGKFHIVNDLVSLRPSLVYEKNSEGNTPLHVAVQCAGADETVKLLIEKAKGHRDVEAAGPQLLCMVNDVGDTALHVAVRSVNNEFDIATARMITALMEDPKLAKHVNNAGESALFLAVDKKNYNLARHILEAAPDDCSYAGRDGRNVLHALVHHTSFYINREHLDFPRKMDRKAARSVSPLIWFLNLLFIHSLWESSMCRDETTNRTLPCTFGTIPEDFVEKVMEKCPSTIEQGDDSGWTPLHLAAHIGNSKFVKLLLGKGNSPAYLRDKEGLSALHIAAKEGNLEVMEELVKACPDIFELLDNRGRTALHAAAESGKTDKVFSFFMGRSDFKGFFNKQDKEGNTFVHLAAISGQPVKLSHLQYARGVDLNVTNKEGFAVLDCVLSRRDFFTASEYRSIGARRSLKGAYLKMGIQKLDSRRKPKLAGTGDGDGDGDGMPSNFVKQVRETNMFVATLIATVTFTAAFTVPGGLNQNGNVGEGLAVLSKIFAFRVFLIANTLGFVFSATSVFVHFLASATITGSGLHREVAPRTAHLIIWSIVALLVAFIAGTYTVVPHSLGIDVVIIFCCCFLSAMFFPLLLDLIAMPKLVWDDLYQV